MIAAVLVYQLEISTVVFSMVPVLVSDLEVCITVAVLLLLGNVDETANLTLSSYLECQSLNCFLQMKAMVELIVNLIDSYSIVVFGDGDQCFL